VTKKLPEPEKSKPEEELSAPKAERKGKNPVPGMAETKVKNRRVFFVFFF